LRFGNSFTEWVKELLYIRENTSNQDLRAGVLEGLSELINSGCFVAGEITTLGCFEEEFQQSEVEGVFFNEFLGSLKEDDFVLTEKEGLIKSFAGHAPHTSSPDLLVYLKNLCKKKNTPFSIHVSESEEEIEFIKTGKGTWADFLKLRGIDFSQWPITNEGSVAYLNSLGLLDDKTIAVHLIRAEEKDYSILKEKNVTVCLCPRSNANLHNLLPDVKKMNEKQIHLCLGTDSLASSESLSIIDEICFMNERFPEISPRDIFNMATINGARALGVSDKFGTMKKGKSGKCFYLPVEVLKGLDAYSGFMRMNNDK